MTLFKGFGLTGRRFALVLTCSALFAGVAAPVNAFVPVLPPKEDPKLVPKFGPQIPYISARIGPAQIPAISPPIGAVVPDDFCLPGKFTDCGDHLRDQPDFSPGAAAEPIFIGDENLAFGTADLSFWVDGQMRATNFTALSQDRNSTALTVGLDKRIGERFFLGAMVVSSNYTKSFNLTGIEDQASGILVGPYFAYEFSENWVLDGRIIAGQSNHTVMTGATQTGSFKSLDGFAALRFAGSFATPRWRLHPSIEIASVIQNDDAYTDSSRGAIAANNSTDTFLTASVLAYYNGLGLGLGNRPITPYVGLEVTQQAGGSGGPFGTVRAGIAGTFGNGSLINLDVAYGAIGIDNVQDKLISIRVEIPF